jgi:hypothetical protein
MALCSRYKTAFDLKPREVFSVPSGHSKTIPGPILSELKVNAVTLLPMRKALEGKVNARLKAEGLSGKQASTHAITSFYSFVS